MKAVLTRAAVGDLAEIARHIGRDSVPAARRFTASCERRALSIGRNPRAFPFAEGLEDLKNPPANLSRLPYLLHDQ